MPVVMGLTVQICPSLFDSTGLGQTGLGHTQTALKSKMMYRIKLCMAQG